MLIRWPLFLILMTFSFSSQAEKLYKILDENGEVSFSQYPPTVKAENESVVKIAVSTGSKTNVTERFGGRYCGKTKLPDRSEYTTSTQSYLQVLDAERASWQESLDELSRNVDISSQRAIDARAQSSGGYNRGYKDTTNEGYRDSIASHSEQFRDLRCALDWVDSEMEGAADILTNNQLERERLIKIEDELKAKLQASCGEIPPYKPGEGDNSAQRKRWYDCSDDLRREIDVVRGQIGLN